MKKNLLLVLLLLIYVAIAQSQTINTVAGNGTVGFSGDGALATSAKIECTGIATDKSNNLYICSAYRIRKVDAATGIITTIAGNGIKGFSGDGGVAINAGFESVFDIALDTLGNIYCADSGRIRKIDYQTNIITTIAGNGQVMDAGDNGPAVNATVYPTRLTVDKYNNLYISSLIRIRKINLNTGIITTIMGDGFRPITAGGTSTNPRSIGDPTALTTDTAGNLYTFTGGNAYILKYFPLNDSFTYIACQTADVGCDKIGNLYMVNSNPSGCSPNAFKYVQIYKWPNNQLGNKTVVAGTTVAGFSGDGGLAVNAKINTRLYASKPVCDNNNNVYFFDYFNNRIRRILAAPLPVKLLFFTAKKENKNVLLNWQTTSETNFSHFNIQQANNGKDFTNIGKVNATCCEYSYTNNNPHSTADRQLYYRLEIVDKDGSKTYSEVKQLVMPKEQSSVNVYPNPATDIITIESKGVKKLTVADGVGKIVQQLNIVSQHQTISTKQWSKGIYILSFDNAEKVKLVKD